MRLIDADALYAQIEKMLKRAENAGADEEMYAYLDCQYAIEEAPTIDPVRRSKWIIFPGCSQCICSLCGKVVDFPYVHCPGCGANMEPVTLTLVTDGEDKAKDDTD